MTTSVDGEVRIFFYFFLNFFVCMPRTMKCPATIGILENRVESCVPWLFGVTKVFPEWHVKRPGLALFAYFDITCVCL